MTSAEMTTGANSVYKRAKADCRRLKSTLPQNLPEAEIRFFQEHIGTFRRKTQTRSRQRLGPTVGATRVRCGVLEMASRFAPSAIHFC